MAIREHGQRRFVPPPVDPWIEVHYDFLALTTNFRNRLTGTSSGQAVIATERAGHLQLSIFQRARIFTQRYTVAPARDLVVAAFPEGGIIDILDYSSTDAPPTYAPEGQIVIDGVKEHQIDDGLRSGVLQYVVQVETKYLELFTRTT
jgi:hypothetical protein